FLKGVVEVAIECIQAAEHGIGDFPLVGEGEPRAMVYDGLRINTSLDLLEAACRKLQKANPDSLEAAICMIKCHQLRGRRKDATELAIRIIAVHPNAPFLYYAVAEWTPSPADALSYCKKGLAVLKRHDPSEKYVDMSPPDMHVLPDMIT
ncbi:hypothetical protein HK102_006292, partial [Quaeritorhiza haematococci]